MSFTSFSFTHPGYIRTVNEDSFYACDEKKIWIVCDGMGGHEEGNFASHLITDIFEDFVCEGSLNERLELYYRQFEIIHNILKNKLKSYNKNVKIGTTLMLLHIMDEVGFCIHSGDSRCYNLREDILSTVTNDHVIEIDDVNGKRKVLSSAIAVPGNLELETNCFKVEDNDRYLLCSDGLYNNVSSYIIKESLQNTSLQNGILHLRQNVLNSKADDNITAIIVGKDDQ